MNENKIICGDCKEQLKKIPNESIDLIYLDPPFHSGKNYDAIWNNGYEQTHFNDTWYSDGQRSGMDSYILWLQDRVKECHRVLKPTGSLYLHCDWHANHHIRLMLDRIFGEKNFRNEIVWYYTKMGNVSKNWLQNHDIILFYSKNDGYTFIPQYDLGQKSALKERLEQYIDLDNTLRYANIKNVKQQLLDSYISSTKSRLGKTFLDDDDIIIDFREKEKSYRKIDNVWYIPFLKGNSKEHIGYPTQKPRSLLERIIKASSNEGDIVLDPMAGGGTTIVSAQQLGRKWIGIDVSPTACRVMIKRLNDVGWKIAEKDVIDYPFTEEQLKALTPIEFENWVRGRIQATKPRKDEGIDAITEDGINFFPYNIKRIAVQIKQQYGVGRAIVQKLRGDIEEHKEEYHISDKYGVIVAFSFSKDAVNHCAKFRLQYGIDIKLLTVDELVTYKIKQGLYRIEKLKKDTYVTY
jgi:DNA modification methylase